MNSPLQSIVPEETLKTASEALSAMDTKTVLAALVYLIAGLCITFIIVRILRRLMDAGRLEKTAGHFLVVFLRAFLLLVTLIITLDRLSLPVNSLIALLSMFTLAVSLSVQNVMSNVVNGIVILINKPFRAGDFVETGSVSGTVEAINLVYTRIITTDNRLIMLPNSSVSTAQVTNYSLMPTRRLEVTVRVSMNADDLEVMDALLDSADVVLGKRTLREVLEEKPKTDSLEEILASFPSNANRSNGKTNAGPAEIHPPEAMPVAFEAANIKFAVRLWVPSSEYRKTYKAMLLVIRRVFETREIKIV